MLAFANALDHEVIGVRQDDRTPGLLPALDQARRVGARSENDQVVLTLRGEGDLELEIWALERKKPLFESTFDIEIAVEHGEEEV